MPEFHLPDFKRALNRTTLAIASGFFLLIAPVLLWASTRNEEIVAWALKSGHVSESATRWLPGLIHDGAVAGAIASLAAGLPAVLFAMLLLYRYRYVRTPIQFVLTILAPPLRPIIAAGLWLARAMVRVYRQALAAVGWLAALLLGGVQSVVQAIRRGAQMVLQAARFILRPVVLVTRGSVELVVAAVALAVVAIYFVARWVGGRIAALFGLIAIPVAWSALRVRRGFIWLRDIARRLGLALLRLAVLAGGLLAAGIRALISAGQAFIVLLARAIEAAVLRPLATLWKAATIARAFAVHHLALAWAAAMNELAAIARAVTAALRAGVSAIVLAVTAILHPLLVTGTVCWRAVCRAYEQLRRFVTAAASIIRAAVIRVATVFAADLRAVLRALMATLQTVATVTWRAVCRAFEQARRFLAAAASLIQAAARGLVLAVTTVVRPFVVAAAVLWQAACRAFDLLRRLVAAAALAISAVIVRIATLIAVSATAVLRAVTVPVVAAAAAMARLLAAVWMAVVALLAAGLGLLARAAVQAWALFSAGVLGIARAIAGAASALARPFVVAARAAASALANYARTMAGLIAVPVRIAGQLTARTASLLAGLAVAYWQGMSAAGKAVSAGPARGGRAAGIVLAMSALAFVAYLGYQAVNPEPTVTVVHWTTGHLLRDGSGLRLLRQMADEFNDAGHLSPSGKQVRVEVYYAGGSDQAPELISRLTTNTVIDKALPDPTLVTPSASHWLVNVNHAVGQEVFDLRDTDSRSLARTYVGIVTYKAMAECLGWPEKPIGYAEIIALRNDPAGWASHDCASLEWGQRPLVAFTDPSTSDTGRAVLLSLYSIAAQKAPEDLTREDLTRPEVLDFVRTFQGLVDHYMPATIPLNTKVCEGPRYGHFFLMPENNLAHLIDGTEQCFINGVEQDAPPLREPMVIIYPHEGSLLRENCACAVNAPWVSEEEAAATELWFSFLREDRQQTSFAAAGFRPGTDLSLPASAMTFGAAPGNIVHTERVHPEVAAAIDASWDIVKRPAVVTFVADTSGSMLGEKLRREKEGLLQAVRDAAPNNWLGLVSFDDTVKPLVPVGPVTQNRSAVEAAIEQMKAGGETALYEAIAAAIRMTDEADVAPDAIRAVVVITDGRANRGATCLDDIVTMASSREVAVSEYCGFAEDIATEATGGVVSKSELTGTGLAQSTRHPVQVFFVAIGDDADLDIGRILATATGADFRGATEADLAEVIEEFGRYF